jgi:hypothetical protein
MDTSSVLVLKNRIDSFNELVHIERLTNKLTGPQT